MGLFDAIGSIIGGFQDNAEQRGVNRTNRDIAQENLQAQREMTDKQINFSKEENALQRAVAERILQIQLEGTTDAAGNKVHYVPGKGFVTQLSPQDAQLLKANQKNALLEATQGAERYRRESAANELGRNDARGLARTFAGELAQPNSLTPASVRAMLLRERSGAVNRAYDDTTNAASRDATRTGLSGSGTTRLLDSIAKQRANAQLDATGGIDLESTDYARKAKNEDRSNLVNALQSTTALASGIASPVDSSAQLLATLANQAASAGGKAGNAGSLFQGTKGITGINTPQLNYQATPNGGSGKISTGIGNALSSLGLDDWLKQEGSNLINGRGYGSKTVDESQGLPWLNNQGGF